MLAVGVEAAVLYPTKEIRVVAALAHLHDDVKDGRTRPATRLFAEDQILGVRLRSVFEGVRMRRNKAK